MSFPSMNQFIECVKHLTLIRNNNLHKFYEVAGIRFLTQNFTLTLLHEMPLFSHHTHSCSIIALLGVKHTDTVTL